MSVELQAFVPAKAYTTNTDPCFSGHSCAVKERVVKVTLISRGVEGVPLVWVQLSMHAVALGQVRVGQVVAPKADQVLRVFLEVLNCSLTIIAT